MTRLLLTTSGVALALSLGASAAAGQAISANDAREAARFTRVVQRVNGGGYSDAVVVGHGAGAADAFFVLTATTRGDSGVLIATVELTDAMAYPVVLERGKTPADIGLGGVEIAPFLGSRDLFDIEVSHRPFMLETSRTFATHHIVQRAGEALASKCDVDGSASASTSTSKGIGSMTSGRYVTIDPVPGQPMLFMVTVIEKTTRPQDREPATTYDSTQSTRRYELQPTGTCRILKPE